MAFEKHHYFYNLKYVFDGASYVKVYFGLSNVVFMNRIGSKQLPCSSDNS